MLTLHLGHIYFGPVAEQGAQQLALVPVGLLGQSSLKQDGATTS
jgi:hypothetical protein